MSIIISASFASKDVLPQHFSFSKPITKHIFENANSKLFKKFNQSCKYFFAKFKYNIIDYLRILDYLPFYGTFENYKFRTNNIIKLSLLSDNLWLTDKFQVDLWADSFYDKLLPKVVRFDIKELTINNSPTLPFEYFKSLTESGTVRILKLEKTLIYYFGDNTNPLSFHEILNSVPNAVLISINPCPTITKNVSEFKIIQRKYKLTELVLLDIVQFIKLELADFIVENFESFYPENGITIEFQNPILTIMLKRDLENRNIQKKLRK